MGTKTQDNKKNNRLSTEIFAKAKSTLQEKIKERRDK